MSAPPLENTSWSVFFLTAREKELQLAAVKRSAAHKRHAEAFMLHGEELFSQHKTLPIKTSSAEPISNSRWRLNVLHGKSLKPRPRPGNHGSSLRNKTGHTLSADTKSFMCSTSSVAGPPIDKRGLTPSWSERKNEVISISN